MARKHGRGRYVRTDPTGGGQWRFWALISLAIVAGIGFVVLYQAIKP